MGLLINFTMHFDKQEAQVGLYRLLENHRQRLAQEIKQRPRPSYLFYESIRQRHKK